MSSATTKQRSGSRQISQREKGAVAAQSKHLGAEVALLALLALLLFTFLSLLSYTPVDLHGTRIVSKAVANWCGLYGAYTADFLYRWLGLAAHLLLASLGLVAGYAAFRLDYRGLALKFGSALLFSFLVSALLSLLIPSIKLFGDVFLSGGTFGRAITVYLGSKIGKIGQLTLLLPLCLASFVVITELSAKAMATQSLSAGFSVLRRVTAWLLALRLPKLPSLTLRTDKPPQLPAEYLPIDDLEVQEYPAQLKKRNAIEPKRQELQAPQTEAKPSADSEDLAEAKTFILPSLDLLTPPPKQVRKQDPKALEAVGAMLERKLTDFGILGKVVAIHPGPVITLFEIELPPEVMLKRIAPLGDDLCMALKTVSVRIVAPIPGKSTVGIEVPNAQREVVYLRDVLGADQIANHQSKLAICLGKDTSGEICAADLKKMPHLLMAGATGTGKSVSLNAIIASILFRTTPDEVKFILVDPKILELKIYEKIPHLLMPVVTEPKKAANALRWCVKEMDRRYTLLAEINAKDIDSYNAKIAREGIAGHSEHLPYIVVIVDEFADLMLMASKDIEDLIQRLTQKARAAGIHVILATQTPRAEVITGVIKANLKARISFGVSSKLDSRVILDCAGAETLLGRGDMLYQSADAPKPRRIHGAYVSEEEIEALAEFLAAQRPPQYLEEVVQYTEAVQEGSEEGEEVDSELYSKSLDIVAETGKASASYLQRRLRIGYNRASRIVEQMEEDGLVGSADGSKQREVHLERIIERLRGGRG